MDFGVSLIWDHGELDLCRQRARTAEQQGYRFVGTNDSLATFSSLSILASETTEAEVGSCIMAPCGRHPAVTASELSLLQEQSGGRIRMVIGRGNHAPACLGLPPVSPEATKAFIMAVRALLRGEAIEWDGVRVPPLHNPMSVPIYLSAYGPRIRRLAGEVADGVALATGSSVTTLRSFLADVAEGAAGAGRSMEEIDVEVMTRASVRDTHEEALDDVRGLLAGAAARHLKAKSQIDSIPSEYRERMRELQARWDREAWDTGEENAKLVDELGLTDYLVGRFAVVGTLEECRAQVQGLEVNGVSRLIVPPAAHDPDGAWARFAEVFA